MKQISTNMALKPQYNIEPIRKLSFTQNVKRSSVLEGNIEALKLGQRDFNDRVEDNLIRKQKMAQHLEDFQNCVTTFETPSPKQTKETRARSVTEAMQIAEKLLGYINIDIAITSHHVSDSAMEIEPIKNPESLLLVMKFLLPRLTSFPYSFLSQVKLRNIHFCYDVHQNNPKHAAIYKQKLVNGLIPVGRMKSDDKIMKHLCRILMFNMCKNVPEFANDWKEFMSEQNSEKAVHEDLAEVFYMLLRVNEGRRIPSSQELDRKIGELRIRLKAFDPAGINYEWSHAGVKSDSGRDTSSRNSTSTNQDKENALFLTSNIALNHKW